MTPKFVPVVGGWFAIGGDWAVRGATKEEAEARFVEAERHHTEIMTRPEPAFASQDSG